MALEERKLTTNGLESSYSRFEHLNKTYFLKETPYF